MAARAKKQESEKNSELMKSYERIRSYMRSFYVFGFEPKEALSRRLQQSARTYDNERRRIENWLGEYMQFQMEQGKIYYITLDASRLSRNPLYESWKAKSFTKNDIMLHFYLLDILRREDEASTDAIVDMLNDDYLQGFAASVAQLPDYSTVEKKLEEYCRLGLLTKRREGRSAYYRLVENKPALEKWQAACAFFAEAAPLGELGSFMLDRLPEYNSFSFKHHFFLYTLDSEILYELLEALQARREVSLDVYAGNNEETNEALCCPLKIYCSTQTGRQYLLCYGYEQQRLQMFRLDRIKSVAQKKACSAKLYEEYLDMAKAAAPHIWGVSLLGDGSLEHLEFTVYVGAQEDYILRRLQREKRSGTLTQVDAEHYRFSIDVYDARELLPWLRSFITRITSLECSNAAVRQTFMQDLQKLAAYYSEV